MRWGGFFYGAVLAVIFAGCSSPENWMLQSNSSLGIPAACDQVLERHGFTAGYSRREKQSLWVSYILSADNLRRPAVKRDKSFAVDPEVAGTPAHPGDYTRTGFDRGHLAPAADMAYSQLTMTESFLMSNISPQTPECNRRYWLEVEKRVRQWALKEDFIYVITGPCFTDGEVNKLGKSQISIPSGFYKAVMDLTPPYKMIAVYAANGKTKQVIFMSVDDLEKITGYDFFSQLDDDLEKKLECSFDLTLWDE